MVAGAPLEAGKPRLLACLPGLEPAKDRLVRLVEAGQHIRHDMAMDGGVVREVLTEVLQLGFLLIARDTDVAALPGGDALFQGGVIERAAAPQDELKLALLAGCRPQLLLERLAHRLGHG